MKYFEIVDAPELKYAPKIQNWYGTFDVRNIKLETYPKLPKRQLFIVEPSENMIFTDFVLYPFLLVTPKVMKVISMYKEVCFYRDVILLNQLKRESQLYYLPVFNETNELQVIDKIYAEEMKGPNLQAEEWDKVNVSSQIFWVNDSKKRHTIISLDLAESLLRRDVFGLGLKEVELFRKK